MANKIKKMVQPPQTWPWRSDQSVAQSWHKSKASLRQIDQRAYVAISNNLAAFSMMAIYLTMKNPILKWVWGCGFPGAWDDLPWVPPAWEEAAQASPPTRESWSLQADNPSNLSKKPRSLPARCLCPMEDEHIGFPGWRKSEAKPKWREEARGGQES